MKIPELPKIPEIPIPEPRLDNGPNVSPQDPPDPAAGAAIPQQLVDHLAEKVPVAMDERPPWEEMGNLRVEFPDLAGQIDTRLHDAWESAKRITPERLFEAGQELASTNPMDVMNEAKEGMERFAERMREGGVLLFPSRNRFPSLFNLFRDASLGARSNASAMGALQELLRQSTEGGVDAAHDPDAESRQSASDIAREFFERARDVIDRLRD